MRIITWNVNSVRTRLERLLGVLQRHAPDVLCLQELKCTDEQFPYDVIHQAGYHAAVAGQKAYNGVAILSRREPTDVTVGLDDDEEDPQARLIGATVDGVRIYSAYVPNGGEVGSDKYAYKLQWFDRLGAMLRRCGDPSELTAICGDFNVAREDADVANPNAWADSVLCTPEVRLAMERVLDWPMVDIGRQVCPEQRMYTWWDYRRLGFVRDDGLRLDYVLGTEPLAALATKAWADRDERKGDKPSDHCPFIVDLDR